VTIEVAHVTKRYGSTRAVDDVSLTAGHGMVGLLGPNGAGKTTLLRMLATVLAPDTGELRLLSRDPGRATQRTQIRRRLGYLPQEPGFHPSFTAFAFVDYVAILKELTERRARHDEVRRVLGVVGLEPVASRKVRALSGGMRRRLALAQALLGDPALLVLDEPTAGLDPEQRLRFRELVSRLGERRTVVLSTHQTEDVAALCQRVLVLDHGRVLVDGTPADVAQVATGRVWLSQAPPAGALVSWRTAEGRWRNLGTPPPGADLAPVTIEDGYLLLVGAHQQEAAA
jgi:ABC-2 type transport system ATP-binding protein